MLKWKWYNNLLNSGIDKKRHHKNEWIFSRTKTLRKVKVELDLSDYATKTDFKNATEIDTSSFAKKVDLASLKSDLDNLDIDKLKIFQPI